MDAITALALSIHNPLISTIGHFLDQDLLYVVVILGLVILGEWKNDKRIKILLSLAFAFVLGWTVKLLVAEPRPCLGAVWCPLDYAFPSTHAVVAFALMFSFIKKKSFPFFLAFALFVSFTRLNLGVHVFVDILGAIPIALVAYYITGVAWVWLERRNWLRNLDIAKKGGP
jgi:membrane-associated phospholipid phosphatase